VRNQGDECHQYACRIPHGVQQSKVYNPSGVKRDYNGKPKAIVPGVGRAGFEATLLYLNGTEFISHTSSWIALLSALPPSCLTEKILRQLIQLIFIILVASSIRSFSRLYYIPAAREFPELPKLPRDADGTALYDWARFIGAETEEELNMLADGETAEKVTKYTGLSREEVEGLRQ
jgi:hypothetical protein